jgi:hypothetical protein
VKFTLKNAVNFKKTTLNFDVFSDYFNIEDVALDPDSSKFGGMKLTKTAINKLMIETADDNTQTINGDIPLVEATLKAKDYNFQIRSDSTFINMSLNSYQDRTGKSMVLPSNKPDIEFMPTYSKAEAILIAEGLLNSFGSFDKTRDYSKVGADIYIKDAQGNTYNQLLNQFGRIVAPHLLLSDDPYSLVIKVPGHFTMNYSFRIGMTSSTGEQMGQFESLYLPKPIAGDVNGDDVIDVLDALYIQTYWGTNNRSADINNDGIVDAKDLAFVERNYGMQNPTVSNAPKPKVKYKGKTLEIIKTELEGK